MVRRVSARRCWLGGPSVPQPRGGRASRGSCGVRRACFRKGDVLEGLVPSTSRSRADRSCPTSISHRHSGAEFFRSCSDGGRAGWTKRVRRGGGQGYIKARATLKREWEECVKKGVKRQTLLLLSSRSDCAGFSKGKLRCLPHSESAASRDRSAAAGGVSLRPTP